MKRIVLLIALACSFSVYAQVKPTTSYASFELGNGLNFGFNDSTYRFKISGNVQPYMAFTKTEGAEDPEYRFNAKRTYFNFGGYAVKEKVSFFIQLDYARSIPLMDGYVGYHGVKNMNIYLGQKQNIANNREMLVMEDQLQFSDRSLLSQMYSRTGREFGLFVDYKADVKGVGIQPFISVTSGDGRNSFGTDSRDVDLGGLKYSARLDIYPLGYFSEGNDNCMADLAREKKPKFVIGAAASYNDGASNAVGEGHGDFMLYNQAGDAQLPDYRQVYTDLLFKYKGFSFLGEYVISTATNLEGTFKSEIGEPLLPTEIANYLAIGTGLNLQAGYVTKWGYALDVRYGMVTPEFNPPAVTAVVQENTSWSVGASKYFKGNSLKIHAALTELAPKEGNKVTGGELMFQVIF